MQRLRLRKTGENEWDILGHHGPGPYIGPGGEILTMQGTGGRGDEWSLEKGSKGNWYTMDVDSMTLERITNETAQEVLASGEPGDDGLPQAMTPPFIIEEDRKRQLEQEQLKRRQDQEKGAMIRRLREDD